MGKTSIAQIISSRDGISMEEALLRVNECCHRLDAEAIPIGDYEIAEDIIMEELGIEPDYLIDLL